MSPNLGWHASTPINYLQCFERITCDYLDSSSMSLGVKVLFSILSLVSAPFFHLKPKHLGWQIIHPVYLVNTSENSDFN